MKQFIIAAALVVAFIGSAFAQSFQYYATSGTAINAGTNYAIITQKSATGYPPRVTYLNASTLFASGTASLQTYYSTNQTLEANGTTNSTTTLTVNSTNGFAVNQWVVIQHLQLNPFVQNEAAVISGLQNTNQIVLQTAPVNPVLPGDLVNGETALNTIPFTTSATAREFNGGLGGIVTGQSNEPLLLTLIGSAVGTNTINTVNASFQLEH